MKKRYFWTLLLLFAFIVIENIYAQDQKYLIKTEFEKGIRYLIKAFYSYEFEEEGDADKDSIGAAMQFEILDILQDGSMIADITPTFFITEQYGSEVGSKLFDTESIKDDSEVPREPEILRGLYAMKDVKFRVLLTKGYRVSQIDNTDAYLKKLAKLMGDKSEADFTVRQKRRLFAANVINKFFDWFQNERLLSARARVGEKWSGKSEYWIAYKKEDFNSEYTLESVKDNTAEISRKLTSIGNLVLTIQSTNIDFDKIIGKGKMFYDIKNNILTKTDMEFKGTGEYRDIIQTGYVSIKVVYIAEAYILNK